MIPDGTPIKPGLTVRDEEGLLCRVEDIRLSKVGYEETHKLGSLVVNYTQLEDGECPAGTKISKDEPGFRTYFTVEEEPESIPYVRLGLEQLASIAINLNP